MSITMNFILVLAGILIIPLLPAFILYRFLPSKTAISGPFKGFDLKLTGAFGGYFLLVITAISVFFPLIKNQQAQTIEDLQSQIKTLQQNAAAKQQWEIRGNILSSSPKLTKIFFDETGSKFYETGEFSMNFDCDLVNGKPSLPKAVCFFNKNDGFKVLNLSRDFNSTDIADYAISFNDTTRIVKIDKVVNIKTNEQLRIQIEKELIQKIKLNGK